MKNINFDNIAKALAEMNYREVFPGQFRRSIQLSLGVPGGTDRTINGITIKELIEKYG